MLLYNLKSGVLANDDGGWSAPVCPVVISRFRAPVPLQLQSTASRLCGHTPLFFQGWASSLSQLGGASALTPHLGRCLLVSCLSLASVSQVFAAIPHPLLPPSKNVKVCSVSLGEYGGGAGFCFFNGSSTMDLPFFVTCFNHHGYGIVVTYSLHD